MLIFEKYELSGYGLSAYLPKYRFDFIQSITFLQIKAISSNSFCLYYFCSLINFFVCMVLACVISAFLPDFCLLESKNVFWKAKILPFCARINGA